MKSARYDLAIVGAGIVGLAHALAAARRGLHTIVFDRDAAANGASVRNFGFITVTGQSRGHVWRRARRSRDVWEEIASKAHIPVIHRDECLLAHSARAMAVLEEFAATEMGEQCEVLDARETLEEVPMANERDLAGSLWSPHELRIEPRSAIPALASYLEDAGVEIRRGVAVRAVAAPALETTAGPVHAGRIVVACGPDLITLFPDACARHATRTCKLQMLRMAPQPDGWRLPASIMSDLGLIRYRGFSELPSAKELSSELRAREPRAIEYGIHAIVVQNADGSLVVGDSHDYAATPDPFYYTDIENEVLRVATDALQIPRREIIERWVGVYPQSESCEWFVDSPDPLTRVVAVTAGNGMSTAFALAEEVVAEL
ncbi:MAG: TIGR03364 family FAD-dependent oxidoreductase [Candidatus Eremiobacteraeota bacterium]|nr:TIGR03364 family FAD-dependent oxidoreductase [Candidatus Eremiobacteraeota bacterium]